MRIKKIIKVLIIIVCGVFYLYSAINTNNGDNFSVIVDTAKPLSIVWPAEVAIVGDNGEKGFRIGANIGRGWLEEAGGEASYKFYVPRDDKYYIWANCLWFDECANAIFAKFDDLEKAIVGNDPIYNQWHWVRGFEVYLGKGTHDLVLSNHSDHISLQEFFITNSPNITPQDCNIVFSDIFYDGFDGCDQGNYQSWKQISGSWLVLNPETQTCLIENSLIGESENEAFITYENGDWQNYSLAVSLKVLPLDSENCEVGICFGLEDPNSYYQLKINPLPNSKKANLAILNRDLKIISEFELIFETDKWQQVQIALKEKNIEVNITDQETVKIETNHNITGGIGLMLKGKITAYIDDVHVRQISIKNK